MDWDKKWLVDFNAGKTQLVSFDRSNNNGSIDFKMDGSVLEQNSSFKMLGLTFSSKLDWGYYVIAIAKPASKEIGDLILSPEDALYLYKSTIRIYMEYCCHIWTGALQLLPGNVRQTTKTDMQDCWSFTCCFS